MKIDTIYDEKERTQNSQNDGKKSKNLGKIRIMTQKTSEKNI